LGRMAAEHRRRHYYPHLRGRNIQFWLQKGRAESPDQVDFVPPKEKLVKLRQQRA